MSIKRPNAVTPAEQLKILELAHPELLRTTAENILSRVPGEYVAAALNTLPDAESSAVETCPPQSTCRISAPCVSPPRA